MYKGSVLGSGDAMCIKRAAASYSHKPTCPTRADRTSSTTGWLASSTHRTYVGTPLLKKRGLQVD